jgi:hypothetical protein
MLLADEPGSYSPILQAWKPQPEIFEGGTTHEAPAGIGKTMRATIAGE